MSERKNTCRIELLDIQIGLTIVLCFFICHFGQALGIPIEALGVTTGAIMCVQDSAKSAYTTSLIRLEGVFFGGLFGVVIVLIDNAIGIPFVFYLLCGVGIVANLLLCKYCNMIYVQARVSGLTQLLVVLVNDGTDRIDYAVSRFIGSLVGALIAVLFSYIFSIIHKMLNQKEPAASA